MPAKPACDEPLTPVIFRVSEGAVVAFFPTIPADMQGHYFGSYMHVGQHSSADYGWYQRTKPATPEQYAELKNELETGFGYRLKVYRRFHRFLRVALEREAGRLRRCAHADC